MSIARGNGRRSVCGGALVAAVLAAILAPVPASAEPITEAGAESRRGIEIAPENRCAPYDRRAYPYPQAVERGIAAAMGAVYGPYTGRYFASRRDTDIEHIVALSEGHDSGLCAAGAELRRRFAADPLNLTLAAPETNRCGAGGKCGHDAAGWLPPRNRCRFADRVVRVKRKYALTADMREAAALERVLSRCESTETIMHARSEHPARPAPGARDNTAPPAPSVGNTDALRRWDDDGNGRIACREARRHAIAPVPRGHPAYPFMHDRDGDGVVCE